MPLIVLPPEEGLRRLKIEGPLDSRNVPQLWGQADAAVVRADCARLIIDAAGVTAMDAAGAALLLELQDRVARRGGEARIEGLAPDKQELLELYRRTERTRTDLPIPRYSAVERVGKAAVDLLLGIAARIAFAGEVLAAVGWMLLHPLRMRWRETIFAVVSMGYEALPVIVLATFLMGISFAVATLDPLRQFGAEIYITNTVALGLVRGVGPVMTGIVLAGRTGASITAELGIMKVNQEIDVLRTMGASPVRTLVLPRVVAAMVATPMLAVVAMASGFVGAGIVVLSLDYPLATFVGRSVEALTPGDFFGSLFKAFVFGIVYATVSSYCGLTAGRGPADVGVSVRSAVVQGMIWVILFDSALVTAYHHLGI